MKNLKVQITLLLLIAAVALASFYFMKDMEISSDNLDINKAILKPEQNGGHIIMTPQDIKYSNAPESLPPGAKIAIVEGDLSKPGPFIARLQFPANYEIPPHFHPAIEHVTVLEGELNFGLGEKFDKKTAKKMPVGSIIVMPTGHKHFAFTQQKPTTIQLHGIGPWGITYVNPADDPRNKAMK